MIYYCWFLFPASDCGKLKLVWRVVYAVTGFVCAKRIAVKSKKNSTVVSTGVGVSVMWIRYKNGPIRLRWGLSFERAEDCFTWKNLIQLIQEVLVQYFLSNACLKSRKTTVHSFSPTFSFHNDLFSRTICELFSILFSSTTR